MIAHGYVPNGENGYLEGVILPKAEITALTIYISTPLAILKLYVILHFEII
jgi:hypothetical protein